MAEPARISLGWPERFQDVSTAPAPVFDLADIALRRLNPRTVAGVPIGTRKT